MEESGHTVSPDQSMFLFLKLISRSTPHSFAQPSSSSHTPAPTCSAIPTIEYDFTHSM
jgi:hypothetical protein